LRYGLEDESSRINLNALLIVDKQMENGGRQLLMALPGMTEEIADAIMDWLDEDDEPREFGAELEYYSSLTPPYAPKNGPLETVEELLLIRGIRENPFLLFGADPYRNGIPMMNSPTGVSTSASTALADVEQDPAAARGWASQFTLFSQEHNVNSSGLKRIHVNQEDMNRLYEELRTVLNDEWSTYIVAYRQNGPSTSESDASGTVGGKLDLSQPGQFPLIQVLDLVDTQVSVTFQGANESTLLQSPIRTETLGLALPLLMDNLSTSNARTLPGRININQASRTLLLGIPGMDKETVGTIISRRDIVPDDNDPNRRFETWILAEGIVDLETMRTLLPFVSVGGDVYRAQIIGYFQGGGVQSRAEVVLDATKELPGILFWRDISHLPHGYPIEILGVDFGEQAIPGAAATSALNLR
ncbi:MAG: general secretion pathway protein GspK, partial [Planctomycetes bacterium]|nr:general secretion pathway protein GspK [Planctomycetota bacterium]